LKLLLFFCFLHQRDTIFPFLLRCALSSSVTLDPSSSPVMISSFFLYDPPSTSPHFGRLSDVRRTFFLCQTSADTTYRFRAALRDSKPLFLLGSLSPFSCLRSGFLASRYLNPAANVFPGLLCLAPPLGLIKGVLSFPFLPLLFPPKFFFSFFFIPFLHVSPIQVFFLVPYHPLSEVHFLPLFFFAFFALFPSLFHSRDWGWPIHFPAWSPSSSLLFPKFFQLESSRVSRFPLFQDNFLFPSSPSIDFLTFFFLSFTPCFSLSQRSVPGNPSSVFPLF